MFYISDDTIEKFIIEDIPYFDLTTTILNIEKQQGEIQFVTREKAVISGTEEVVRIFDKFGIKTMKYISSGTYAEPDEVLIKGIGRSEHLHFAWKICLNILEYSSGIASRTRRLVDKAKDVNPEVELVTTRKIFPGTKDISTKSIIVGGAYPHRLGLSETILVFAQHLEFLDGIDNFVEKLKTYKSKACEKKIIVETDNILDAIILAEAGVDGIQIDKVEPSRLVEIVNKVREINRNILLIGAGGINEKNISDYSRTGVDALATSSVYFGKPVDIKTIIKRV